MANLMGFTIILSLVYSFLFLIPLLTLLGPNGEIVSTWSRIRRLLGWEPAKDGEIGVPVRTSQTATPPKILSSTATASVDAVEA